MLDSKPKLHASCILQAVPLCVRLSLLNVPPGDSQVDQNQRIRTVLVGPRYSWQVSGLLRLTLKPPKPTLPNSIAKSRAGSRWCTSYAYSNSITGPTVKLVSVCSSYRYPGVIGMQQISVSVASPCTSNKTYVAILMFDPGTPITYPRMVPGPLSICAASLPVATSHVAMVLPAIQTGASLGLYSKALDS